jgi:hypothetical protein
MTAIRRGDVRAALDVVTGRGASRVPSRYHGAAAEAAEAARSWVFASGVQGVGIGERTRGGARTGELALKLYVEVKRPVSALECAAPHWLVLPWQQSHIRVDVEAIGELELHNAMQRSVQPALPGCAIANPGRPFGTFGCLVREAGGSSLYILSAAHVIANNTFPVPGQVVIQPGIATDPSRVIARLHRWGELRYEGKQKVFNNLFDAAIAVVEPGVAVREIYAVGPPKGYSLTVNSGDMVRKCGAATLMRVGEVLDTDFHCVFRYRNPDDSVVHAAGFYRQVLCTRISDGGDSGAAVLDSSDRIVGLIIGGANQGTVFSRIGPILNRLNLELA